MYKSSMLRGPVKMQNKVDTNAELAMQVHTRPGLDEQYAVKQDAPYHKQSKERI